MVIKRLVREIIVLTTFTLISGYACLNVKAAYETDNNLATDSDATAVTEEYNEFDGPCDIQDDILPYDTEIIGESASEDCEIVAGAVNIQPIYNGVDYSAVFDYDYYIKNNPDVASAFGENYDEILAHFVNYGMNEGRSGSKNFDVYSYAYLYPDLRQTFGNDLKGYYYHYINNGKSEGRITAGTTSMQGTVSIYDGVDYSSVYNYEYYIMNNTDIKNAFGLDDTACLKHFIDFGMSEGRRGSDDFDVISYKNSYMDLRAAFLTDLRAYYYHYLECGKSEGRIAKGNTKLIGYLTSYNNKDYSSVYDFNYYVNKYSDIKNSFANDDAGALQHFVNSGMSEGRQGKENFDVWSYGYSYSDLRNAFGNSISSYYEHYISDGKKEGRNLTSGVTSSNNEKTVYADYDFSSIYDIVYYTSHNLDVRNAFKFDDAAILEHFAQNGLNEGRKALDSYSNADYETAKTKVAEYNKKIEEESIKKYPKAMDVLNQIGWDLAAAFNWSAGLKYYSGVSKAPDPGINYFADFGFDNGRGNCYVLAAVFYEMAYSLGYSVRQIYGTVPLRAGGQGPHSWVEIDMDGGTYVFDPDFTNETKRNGFKFSYGQSGTWIYNYIGVMHE